MIDVTLKQTCGSAEGFYVVLEFGLVGEMGSQCLSIEFLEEFAKLLLLMVLGKQAEARCCSFRMDYCQQRFCIRMIGFRVRCCTSCLP